MPIDELMLLPIFAAPPSAQFTSIHPYVPARTIAKRRAANRRAKASRRINRKAAK